VGGFTARLKVESGQHWFEVDREEYNRAYEAAVLRHYFPPVRESAWKFVFDWLRKKFRRNVVKEMPKVVRAILTNRKDEAVERLECLKRRIAEIESELSDAKEQRATIEAQVRELETYIEEG
jgi:hypothetical protein